MAKAKDVDELSGPAMTAAVLSDPDFKASLQVIREQPAKEPEPEPEKPKAKAKEEVAEEADDEPNQPAAPTDGSDDDEAELDDELLALAEERGVDPELLEGCESVKEAARLIDRVMRLQGYWQQPQERNGHAETPPPVEEIEDLDLGSLEDEYDENSPIPKHLKKLTEAIKQRDLKLKRIEAESRRAQEYQAQQAQAQAEEVLRSALRRKYPEIYGTDSRQTIAQRRKTREAVDAARVVLQDSFGRGVNATYDMLVDEATKWKFGNELVQKKIIVKREQVTARAAKKKGAPAANGQELEPPYEPLKGDPKDDPALKAAIRKVRRGQLVD